MSDRLPIQSFYPHAGNPAPIRSGTQIPAKGKEHAGAGTSQPGATSFRDIFQQKILTFSQHAEMRLRQRGITLQTDQIEKINNALDKAAAKGAKDSLVLMKDMALIVNVKNRTVITAIDGPSLQDHVFTQIDSAVIIP